MVYNNKELYISILLCFNDFEPKCSDNEKLTQQNC
jgi:hypothetical protein